MIHLDYARARRPRCRPRRPSACTATSRRAPRVCPADAIKIDDEGVVLSALAGALHRLRQLRARLPVRRAEDRRGRRRSCGSATSATTARRVGAKPMCATVCPSGALFYGTPRGGRATCRAPVRRTASSSVTRPVHTRNHLMVPLAVDTVVVGVDAAPRRSPAELHLEEALC